jgi:oxygen-independent coproporphyrinogen-3 oxidase
VKIKQYFITETFPEFKTAVAEIMMLFKINEGTGVYFPDKAFVLIENTAYYGIDKIKVTTKIHYCSKVFEKINETLVLANDEAHNIAKRLARFNVFTLLKKITGTTPSPWGILSGVRPGKIAARLLDMGLQKHEIIKTIIENYGVEKKRAEILTDISISQQSIFREFENKNPKRTVSIYIGVPYCLSKCLFCSFPSAVLPKKSDELDVFFEAFKSDINAAGRLVFENNLKIETIYIGGGTPTSLNTQMFGQLLHLTKQFFQGDKAREFTVEAGRPDSIDDEKIEQMRRAGVTRVSINPQTMQDKTLTLIGRRHTAQDTIDAFQKIRQAKIPVINMDVIAGLPGETEHDIADTMTQIENLGPDNITVHTLAIKRGSALKDFLWHTPGRQDLKMPDETIVRNMLDIAALSAARMGMRPYYLYRQKYTAGNLENTGYAKPNSQCLYNMQIIEERQTILGIGPSAGTKIVNLDDKTLKSCYNPKDVQTYIKNLPVYLNERKKLLEETSILC